MYYWSKNLITAHILVKKTYKVLDLPTSYRFNTYCESFIPDYISRKGVKKAIKKGELQLNGEVVEGGRWLKKGDEITVVNLNLSPPKEYQIDFEVVFEDDFIAVINKPAGVSVSGNQFKTIENALGYNLKVSNSEDKLNWPLPVHRLDNQTSGLLIIAKTKTARIKLGQSFEKKEVRKKYAAIVMGNVKGDGLINFPVQEKESKSEYKSLKVVTSLKNEFLSLLELKPLTGRTHQLRIHCQSLGSPILGDKLYGQEGSVLKHKGLFLTAIALSFKHPISSEDLMIEIPIPQKFLRRLENEERRFLKFNNK